MPQNKDNDNANGYILPPKSTDRIKPDEESDSSAAAIDLIRQKINSLHEAEPKASEEVAIAENIPSSKRSKHQEYMHNLSNSGKSLAEIQIAWHEYYQDLPDHEKHEVWQEFYSQHGQTKQRHASSDNEPEKGSPPKPETHSKSTNSTPKDQPSTTSKKTKLSKASTKEIQGRIVHKVAMQSKKQQANLKSLFFGLAMGSLVLLIATFSFFNERFIAPFITPSRVLSSTPLIIDENSPVGEDPKIIIPKINVEIPVVYDEESIQEDAVQRALEDGVLHYPTTPEPGKTGNSVFFGHSSNNILNRGDYKFAFVLLNQLEEGDTFMLEKDGTRYIYRVFETKVVPPTDLSVLDPHADKSSVATLITCDPPGTAINRLVVTGEQISPDPIDNEESTAPTPSERPQPTELPSDAPSLWSRMF